MQGRPRFKIDSHSLFNNITIEVLFLQACRRAPTTRHTPILLKQLGLRLISQRACVAISQVRLLFSYQHFWGFAWGLMRGRQCVLLVEKFVPGE